MVNAAALARRRPCQAKPTSSSSVRSARRRRGRCGSASRRPASCARRPQRTWSTLSSRCTAQAARVEVRRARRSRRSPGLHRPPPIGNGKQSKHGLSKNSLQLIADVTKDPFTLFGCNRVVLVKNDKDATRGRRHARNATLSHALSVRSVCGNQSCGGASARYRGRRG